MTKFYKTFIFFLMLPLVLYPQSQDIKFERISVEQGLSHSTVYCLLQDSKGFMWIGNHRGLNRNNRNTYDFTRYFPDEKNH